MSHLERSLRDWVILGLWVALVATHLTCLVLLRTGGPLIGLMFYLVLLVFAIRVGKRDRRSVMVGGLAGLAVHVVEVVPMGCSTYPVLMVLNLVLPAGLALVAWLAEWQIVSRWQ